MKYKFDIQGMHCKGCVNLIDLSLEEAGFKNIKVDLKGNSGEFTSEEKDLSVVQQQMVKVFEGLPGYTFNNFSYGNNNG
jgi:copper chaperone CopZ